MNILPLQVNPSPADSLSVQYARFPILLPRAQYHSLPALSVKGQDGRTFPCQSEILAHWPDGSLRILHAIAPLPGGSYEVAGCEAASSAVENPVRVTQRSGAVEVSTGKLEARFGARTSEVTIRLNHREVFTGSGIDLLVENGAGQIFRASLCRDVQATVEVEGPLRSVVALRGKCTGEAGTFLDFRLRFEFLAGVEGISLACSFFNLEKGQDFFDVNAIELRFGLKETGTARNYLEQINHGIFGEKWLASTPLDLEVRADNTQARTYVGNFENLGDETQYPFYLQNGAPNVENWAAVGNGETLLLAEMRDFHLLRPKAMRLSGGALHFDLWPRDAGHLELQQGRSREVIVDVALREGEAGFSHTEAGPRIAQLSNVWRAQYPRDTYAAVDFFDQSRVLDFDPANRPRFERWLGSMATGFNSVATFFDLGDSPDAGYKTTYMSLGRQRRMRGEDGGMRWFSTSLQNPALPMNDLEDFEPVWVNNEYDVIFALGTEYLRTGNLALFQKLRWFSRHTIEVDFLHYSDHKWLHRAQPAHSARHTTTGAYPSHFWTQGLAQYYFLTGDPDALEIIIALADKTIENLDDPELGKLNSGLNREVGWGILSLVCAYEASGDKRYDEFALRLLKDCIAEGVPHDIPVFSFGHTSLMLAVRQYLQVHDGEVNSDLHIIKRWFLEFLDHAIVCSRQAPPPLAKDARDAKVSAYSYDAERLARGSLHGVKARPGIFEARSMALDSFAYAYEISGDKKYVTTGLRSLEAMLDSGVWHTPINEGKPFAMTYRTWINYFKALEDLGLLEEWDYKY